MKKVELREIVSDLNVAEYMDYRLFLGAVYRRIESEKPGFTYQQYSEILELGSKNAHSVIHGKRDLSPKSADKVARIFGLVKRNKRFFLALVAYSSAKSVEDKEEAYKELVKLKTETLPTELTKSQLRFFENWYNAVILEVLSIPGSSDDPDWLAKRISPKVKKSEIKNSIELLKSLGYLEFNTSEGCYRPSFQRLSTGDEVYGMAVFSFHQQMLNLAKLAIDKFDADEREFSAATLTLNNNDFEKLRSEVIKLRKLALEMSDKSQNPDVVLQLNLQLFPVFREEG